MSGNQTVSGTLTVQGNASMDQNLIVGDILTVEAPQGSSPPYIDIQGQYIQIQGMLGTVLQVSLGLLAEDIEAYGFLGSQSDPAKGTGGGAILMGHGFTSSTAEPQLNLTDTVGGGSGASASLFISNEVITGINITNAGSNYTTASATVISNTGSGAVLTPVIRLNGGIQSITISNGGHGYNVGDTVQITGNGSGATAAVGNTASGVITLITVSPQGSGYTFADIAVNTSTGSGARLAPVINQSTGAMTGINIYSGGTGYSSSDTITITNNPHNTLYLQQLTTTGTSPANLDLGNLTAHGTVKTANNTLDDGSGNMTIKGSILTAGGTQLVLESSAGINLCSASGKNVNISLGGTLAYYFCSTGLNPLASDTYGLGGGSNYWAGVCSYEYYGYVTTIQPLDTEDDLAIVKGYKTKTLNGKQTIDIQSLPQIIADDEDKKAFYGMGKFFGLLLGCAKQSAFKHDKHEAAEADLLRRIENLEKKLA